MGVAWGDSTTRACVLDGSSRVRDSGLGESNDAIRGRYSGVAEIARPEPDYHRLVGALIDAAQRQTGE